jgi:hypothetical protein
MIRANHTDFVVSLAVLGGAVFPIVFGAPNVVKKYKMIFRIAWILMGVLLTSKKLYLSAVILITAGFAIQYTDIYNYIKTQAEIISEFQSANLRDPRFDESVDLDLQTARGTLQRDGARWFDPGRKKDPILLFPPSPEQLALIGNNGDQ